MCGENPRHKVLTGPSSTMKFSKIEQTRLFAIVPIFDVRPFAARSLLRLVGLSEYQNRNSSQAFLTTLARLALSGINRQQQSEMLSILRKARLKDKEMRVLMLYADAGSVRPIPISDG